MKNFLLVLIMSLSIFYSNAQQKEAQFNAPVNYLVYLPQGYENDTAKKWPLVLFLHGSGESGEDLQKVKVHGPPKLIEAGKQFPFIVISPQAPPREGWEPEMMRRFILGLKKQYRVDDERLYLTGLSMGGYGTWAIAMKYPGLFAAIAPICGGGDTADIWKLRHTPVWCFHGAKDDVVNPEQSYRMMDALKKYNPAARLTIYPEANHDSWTATYNNDSLYTWLLAQKKFHFSRNPISEKKLMEYTGRYTQERHDTVDLVIQDQKLVVKQQPSIEVIPYSDDNFFIIEGNEELELKYHRNKAGKIDKFVLYADKERDFIKVK